MAYHIEKETGDLVIDGWQSGIGSSPLKGLGDLKSGNISTIPGEISLSYNRTRQSQYANPTSTLTALSANSITVSAGSAIQSGLLRGSWILITSSSITNLTNSGHFYVKASVSGVLTLSADYEGSTIINFGTTGSATFTVVAMGQPIAWTATNESDFPSYEYFVLDANGRVWKNPPGELGASQSGLGIWSLIDYSAVTGAAAKNGLFIMGSYLFVVSSGLYYKAMSTLGHGTAWTQWSPTGIATYSNTDYHYTLVSDNNVAYICNGSQIDSVLPIGTFDPATSSTYTYTPAAILLPLTDVATTLEQIVIQGGTNIIVGALSNVLYVWAPGSTSAAFSPLFLAESFTQSMITVNNLVYVFAGSKGNVYVTNASSVTTALTVPDYVANSTGGNQDPFYVWGGAMYLRGRVFFSVKAPNCGGVWSFIPTINYYPEQDIGLSLRCENQNSYQTYSGYATIFIPSLAPTDQQANGAQFYTGWDDGTSGASLNPYGIDFSDTIPAVNGAIIETDAIPTGTLLKKRTLSQLEYKLATAPTSLPVTSTIASGATSATLSSSWTGSSMLQWVVFSDGEAKIATFTNGSTSVTWSGGLVNSVSALIYLEMVLINYRTDLTAAWSTPVGAVNFAGQLSGYFPVEFEKTQWLQLQIITRSTSVSPTFTPLVEIRVR